MYSFLIYGLSVSLIGVAQSQNSPSNLPSCVATCVATSFQSSNCLFMGLQNWPCACSIQSFISSVGSCFDGNCSADNANIGKNFVDIECSNSISTSIPLPFSPPTSLPSTSNGSNSTSTTSETSGRSTDGPLTPPIPPTSSSKETSSLTSLPPSATSPTPRPSPTPIQTATTATTSIISTTAASSTSNIVGPSFTLTPPVTVTSTSSGSIESLPSTTTSGGSKSHGNKILTTVLILFVLALCGNENVV